jgi:adenylate cyclase
VRPLSTLLVSRVRLPETVHTARVTVLFADLRGYTGMAERLPAARVLPLLDEFCLSLASAAEAHGGTVFYMAGDGMMAGFGLHAESGHGAREALAAGHDMLDAFSVIS